MKWPRKRDKYICSFILIGLLEIITLSTKRNEEKGIKLEMEVVKSTDFVFIPCLMFCVWFFIYVHMSYTSLGYEPN